MKKIRVIIVDDERTSRAEIRRLLESYPEFIIVAEARNADEAKILIEAEKPDLLFLDIQMPQKSGFELLESLEVVPEVIFITAFDQYAVKAFEVSAIDYLMKPVREERFAKAIEQVRTKVNSLPEQRIFIKDGNQYHFIKWSSVYLIESLDNYARLHFDGKKVFLKSSLNQLESKIDEAVFFRINRSQIINLQFIDKITTASNGRVKLSLTTGDEFEVSGRQSIKFKTKMRS